MGAIYTISSPPEGAPSRPASNGLGRGRIEQRTDNWGCMPSASGRGAAPEQAILRDELGIERWAAVHSRHSL